MFTLIKLINKHQILYLDRITTVARRHLVNDIDLCRSPKSPKKSIKPPILGFNVIQGHWIRRQSRASYDFLLVINSNISRTVTEIQRLIGQKSQILPTPSHLAPSFGVTPSNSWKSFTVPETKIFRAADSENLVILASTVFDWSTHVTDGRTDRQTDRQNCDG